jgi:hypothetical protein
MSTPSADAAAPTAAAAAAAGGMSKADVLAVRRR